MEPVTRRPSGRGHGQLEEDPELHVARAPELFLTAVAVQTQRIRVGHGAVVCVPQMNHPIRVAERAAVLDILSGGRLEFGTARASTWTELGGFGVDPDTTKISCDEYVHLLPRLWTEERVAHDEATVSMPERPVLAVLHAFIAASS